MRAPAGPPIEEWDWPRFAAYFAGVYRPVRAEAEHVTIMGPTKTGKSTLALWVASHRRYVVAIIVKPEDPKFIRALRSAGYKLRTELPDAGAVPRIYIHPENKGETSWPAMRKKIATILDQAYDAHSWTPLVDEGAFVCECLKLGGKIKNVYQTGRTIDHGIIFCAIRPAWLPHDVYSSAQHLFFFATNDELDLEKIGGLNGMNARIIRDTVASLGRGHRFVYVNTNTGFAVISKKEGP